MYEPWDRDVSPEERAERDEAYRRLAEASRRIGQPLERLSALLRHLARSEEETRLFLSEVYGVPDDLLDDLVRVRLAELDAGRDAHG